MIYLQPLQKPQMYMKTSWDAALFQTSEMSDMLTDSNEDQLDGTEISTDVPFRVHYACSFLWNISSRGAH